MAGNVNRRWYWLAIAAAIAFVLWRLSSMLMPFVVAAMFAYLGDPLADRLERLRIGRTLAVSIVFVALGILVIGVLLLVLPLITRQIASLVQNVPHYVAWVEDTAWPWLQATLHLDPHAFDSEQLVATLKAHIGSVGGMAGQVLGTVSRSGLGVVLWLTNLVLIPVVTFYLLRDWDRLVAAIDRLLPRAVEPTVAHLAHASDVVLGAFVRGQLLVMVALGVYYGAGLSLVAGLSVGALIGMIAGLLSFVPYLGFITGFGAALVAALVQYGDWNHVLVVCGVFIVGQLLEGYVLVPKLVGEKIGLHPVAVIFAVLAGGELAGFLGVLLALPAASVVMVLLRHAIERYRASGLYDEEAAKPPVIVVAPGAGAVAAPVPAEPPAGAAAPPPEPPATP